MDYYGLLFLYYLKGLSGKSILRLFFNIETGGTEQLLPENTSVPTTTPILADIQYPDGLRTDQYFTYRETPTTITNKARIKAIKGQTLKWNQLVQNGNFADTSGWSATRVTLSASNNELTATVLEASTGRGQRVFKDLGINDEHKRLYSVEMKATSGKTLAMGINTQNTAGYNTLASATATGSWQKLQAITSLNQAFIMFGLNNDTSIGDSYQVRNVQVFDLTKMFGEGKEPSTVEEFASLFPLPYYDYNAGSLLSFNGNGIKTVGKNLLPNKTYKTGNNVYIGSDSDDYEIWLNAGTYTITRNVNENCGLFYRDINGSDSISIMPSSTVAGVQSRTITITESSYYIFWFYKSGGGVDLENVVYFQLEFGSTATSYEPYTESVLNLPISTYFPTGMKQAGNVYDELIPTKSITRIGAVDLGSLDWTLSDPSSHIFRGKLSGMNIKIPNASDLPNALLANYQPEAYNPISANDNGYFALGHRSADDEDVVVIIDNKYSDNASFISNISGQYLFYELATPTETPITTEDANEALSLLMGKSVSSNNANQLINIITKGE